MALQNEKREERKTCALLLVLHHTRYTIPNLIFKKSFMSLLGKARRRVMSLIISKSHARLISFFCCLN